MSLGDTQNISDYLVIRVLDWFFSVEYTTAQWTINMFLLKKSQYLI